MACGGAARESRGRRAAIQVDAQAGEESGRCGGIGKREALAKLELLKAKEKKAAKPKKKARKKAK